MDSGPVRGMAAAGVLLLVLGLAGTSDGPMVADTPDERPLPGDAAAPRAAALPGAPSAPEAGCTVSDILEPSCGVWWGASPYQDDIEPLEAAVGREMDIVYTWRGIDQPHVPARRELDMIAEGRVVHTNIEARRFTRSGHPDIPYSNILDGEFDSSLRSQARTIADTEVPYFVTFDHEADANKRYNSRGTPEEFVRSWRHIVDLYREEGADNVIWVWNVTGWADNLDRLPGLWPGNDYVDWISWEAYNMTGCDIMPNWTDVHSFEEALAPAYEWIQQEGPRHGIDATKPVMIGEMGTTDIGARQTFDWYAEIPEVLKRYERVRAVKVWDNKVSDGCDFRIKANENARRGFELAGQDPYVNLPERVRRLVEFAEGRGRD
ncbi:glycosyl hydrolase [Nocardiopsis sp. MG754419]|uniref:glycoside hydrolase family 26 protein n=1 Tax=Nocardiopsis sp. MG754419 TaxID=2259865 RepID=UPI0027DCB431|nr:glycosyl hydrolase [Nocardiopsis sp. MG754419]MBR8741256.1 glycosyl hydrolase family 26 [Nocardiopsis sp. MG754419]